MAIYGIGAYYTDTDVSAEFVDHGVACVDWPRDGNPAVHRQLAHIKTGDIIYIKSRPPGTHLTVKAVGIVENELAEDFGDLGRGFRVRWLWRGPAETWQESPEEMRLQRTNTLYEEFSQTIQTRVLNLLFSPFREATARSAVQG